MNSEVKEKIKKAAFLYENEEFLKNDPSQFMHRYKDEENQELTAFIAANLAFGNREQINKHISIILDEIQKQKMTPYEWLYTGTYRFFFEKNGLESKKSFYRMFSYESMFIFFNKIHDMLKKERSLGSFIKKEYEQNPEVFLHQTIARQFPKECNLIPHTDSSACKRINMFLRWVVRTDSCVDLGLWTWYNKQNLLLPLDTHVMQQSSELQLISLSASGKVRPANLKTCLELTEKMKEVFPDDPVKADFALFSLDLEKKLKKSDTSIDSN